MWWYGVWLMSCDKNLWFVFDFILSIKGFWLEVGVIFIFILNIFVDWILFFIVLIKGRENCCKSVGSIYIVF